MADRVIHFEVTGRDGASLQRFYSDLFGWAFDTNNPGGYGMVSSDQTGIVVGVGSTPDGSSGQVTGYVAVPDIDAALARAETLGGRTIMPKMSPGPDATIALLADPEGHVIGLTQA
jgi:predicted enzyme related to lactoylglutathione lyase